MGLLKVSLRGRNARLINHLIRGRFQLYLIDCTLSGIHQAPAVGSPQADR
jgi:hypothetical protein